MRYNVSYRDRIIWQANGWFHALGGIHADTLDGIKRLIDKKIDEEDELTERK